MAKTRIYNFHSWQVIFFYLMKEEKFVFERKEEKLIKLGEFVINISLNMYLINVS